MHLSPPETPSKPNVPAPPPPNQDLTMKIWSRTKVICGAPESASVVSYPCTINGFLSSASLFLVKRTWLQTRAVGRRWKGSAQIAVSTNIHTCSVLCTAVITVSAWVWVSDRLWSICVCVCVPRWWRWWVLQCSEDFLSEVGPNRHSDDSLPALLPWHQVLLCAASLPTGQCVFLGCL